MQRMSWQISSKGVFDKGMRTPKAHYFEGGVIEFSVDGDQLNFTCKLWNDHGFSQYIFKQGSVDLTKDFKEQCMEIALEGIKFRNDDVTKYGHASTFWMSEQEQENLSRQVARKELGSQMLSRQNMPTEMLN